MQPIVCSSHEGRTRMTCKRNEMKIEGLICSNIFKDVKETFDSEL